MENRDKKHPCPDCRHCQWCSDDRCRLCLNSDNRCRKKLSMAEQIALFEQLNKAEQEECSCRLEGAPSTRHED